MLCPDYSPNSAGDLSIQLCPDYSPNSAGDLSIQQTCVLTVQVGIKTGGGYEEGGGGLIHPADPVSGFPDHPRGWVERGGVPFYSPPSPCSSSSSMASPSSLPMTSAPRARWSRCAGDRRLLGLMRPEGGWWY